MSQRTASKPASAPKVTSTISRPVLQPALLDVPSVPLRRCGLDEVGRGALAGPLVAAAVILPGDIADRLGALSRFLRDSKTVPRARREDLALAIRAHALALEVVSIPVDDINRRGRSPNNPARAGASPTPSASPAVSAPAPGPPR